jgi:MFS family permease
MSKHTPLVILSLSATLLMTGVGMIVALLPQRIHAMTGSLESVGLVASVLALAYLLALLPVGFLSDRFGAKPFLVIGYILCALSGVVFFGAGSPAGIYAGRAIQGLGEAPIWALGPAILSMVYPSAKGRAIGTYNGAIHAGLTLGPLLGLLIAPEGGSDAPFVVFAILCLAGGIIVLAFLKTPVPPADLARPSVREFLAVLRRRKPVLLLAGILFYGSGYGTFLSVLPVSLTQTHGFSNAAVSGLFVLYYAAVGFSQVLAGPVSDRIGRRSFLRWGMLLAAFGTGTFPFVPGLWAFGPLGLAGIGLGIFCVAATAELNECVSDALKGAISGCFYFSWGSGYVLGPLLMGAAVTQAPVAGFLALALAFGAQALLLRFAKD